MKECPIGEPARSFDRLQRGSLIGEPWLAIELMDLHIDNIQVAALRNHPKIDIENVLSIHGFEIAACEIDRLSVLFELSHRIVNLIEFEIPVFVQNRVVDYEGSVVMSSLGLHEFLDAILHLFRCNGLPRMLRHGFPGMLRCFDE